MSWQHISTACPKGYLNQHGHAVSLRVKALRHEHETYTHKVARCGHVCSCTAQWAATASTSAQSISLSQIWDTKYVSKHQPSICLKNILGIKHLGKGCYRKIINNELQNQTTVTVTILKFYFSYTIKWLNIHLISFACSGAYWALQLVFSTWIEQQITYLAHTGTL